MIFAFETHTRPIRRYRLPWILLIFFFSCHPFVAAAGDSPFNTPANWGGVGLLEIPTARTLEDGVVSVGFAQADPYRWITAGMGVLPGLEVGFRLTELIGFPTRLSSAYGDYKDKALDVKYQILPESKYLPAIAVGLHDIQGTKLFPAEYLVMSRQIYPFDFTLGFGTQRLKGDLTLPIFDDVGLFGGVEWAVHDRLHLLAEYNPILYEDDKKLVVPEGSASPFNVGLRFHVAPGICLGASYQRGDTFAFSGSLKFEIGRPMVSKRPDPPRWTSPDRDDTEEIDLEKVVEEIHGAIQDAGFQNVTVYTNGTHLAASFENRKYLSNQKAAGRVLRILLFYAPPGVEELSAVFTQRHLAFLNISVSAREFKKYLYGEISDAFFEKIIRVDAVDSRIDRQFKDYVRSREEEKLDYQFAVKPSIQTHLNDPSGFFKSRVGIKPSLTATLWEGAAFFARYDIPFYSDISSSVTPPPDAVRSDSWQYFDETEPILDRLVFDQVLQMSENTLIRLSTGYFEPMYAGVGGEVLKFVGEGALAVGLGADWVMKREPGAQPTLTDQDEYTLLGNLYYNLKAPDMTFLAQYGRFLAGDIGWRFTVSRTFDTGVTIGGWYSITDTDDIQGEFNKDYNDKGVFLSLPARMFKENETNEQWYYAVSPWTRDVGARVYHWNELFGMTSNLVPASFKKNIDRMKE